MKESPRKPPIATDNELLMRFARRNDHQAFRELVERHADMVMAVCRQVTSQQQDAEDAFQTAFVILAERGHRMLHKASVGGWLYRVAYRASLRAVRRRTRRREEPLTTELDAVHDLGSPLERIQARELQRILHEEIQRLPSRYREVVILCDLQQYTRAQTAERLDSTEQSVKAALARARRRLRMQLLRRGVVMSTTIVLTQRAMGATNTPPELIDSAVQAGMAQPPYSSSRSPNSTIDAEWSFDMIFSPTLRIMGILLLGSVSCTVLFILVAQGNDRSDGIGETLVVALPGGASDSRASATADLHTSAKLAAVGEGQDDEAAGRDHKTQSPPESSLENAAKQAYEVLEARRKWVDSDIESLYRWSKRWMQVSTVKGAARKAHLRRMQTLHTLATDLYKARPDDENTKLYYTTAYYVAEAEHIVTSP